MPDGRRLVCVSEDGRATLWDGIDGRFIAAIGSHDAHCMAVSVSSSGLVATVGEDGLVAVQGVDSPSISARRTYECSIEGCARSHSGDHLAVARDDGRVDILYPSLEKWRPLAVSTSAARTVAWSDDDSILVVGAYDGLVHFASAWSDGSSGEPANTVWDNARAWPRSVAVSGWAVAVGSQTRSLTSFS